MALQYVAPHLRCYGEVALAAVIKSGAALQYVTKEARRDRDIVLAAVQNDCRALYWASEALKRDSHVVLTAAGAFRIPSNPGAKTGPKWCSLFAMEKLTRDKSVVLTAVEQDGLALERELQQRLFEGDDAREGLAAYLEKRAPAFTGR